MNHPKWNDLPSAKRFMEIVGAGRAKMVVRVFEVVTAGENSDPK